MSKIGFQNGVEAARLRMKKLDPGGFNASGTGAWDKFFRTIKHLVDEHDAAVADPEPPPPPPPPPPPTTSPWFPRTYNKVLPNGQDARFCVSSPDPAFWKTEGGLIWDKGGASYDDGGLCVNGLRSTDTQVPGLKPANEMDGRGACDPYGPFPPWPDGSYVK